MRKPNQISNSKKKPCTTFVVSMKALGVNVAYIYGRCILGIAKLLFLMPNYKITSDDTLLFHKIKRLDKGKWRMEMQRGRTLVFHCLADGLRTSLTGVLPGHCDCLNRSLLLPGLNEGLIRLFCGCEDMTRSLQLCNVLLERPSQMPSVCTGRLIKVS